MQPIRNNSLQRNRSPRNLASRKIKWLQFLLNSTNVLLKSLLWASPSSTLVTSLTSPWLVNLLNPIQSDYSWHLTGRRSTYWARCWNFRQNNLSREFVETQSPRVRSLPKSFVWFYDYWLLQQSRFNPKYTTHAHFKLMFLVCVDRKGFYNIIAISKFYQRWITASTLIMNLSFFESSVYAFTHKAFIEESMAFNWQNNFMDYRLFKYASRLFYLRDSAYGNETRLRYLEEGGLPVDAAIVSDVKAHERNLFYLQRSNFFTIGLAPANYDPWVFSFPVPLLSDSLLGQYYFLGSLVRLSNLAQSSRFEFFYKSWFNIKFSLTSIKHTGHL